MLLADLQRPQDPDADESKIAAMRLALEELFALMKTKVEISAHVRSLIKEILGPALVTPENSDEKIRALRGQVVEFAGIQVRFIRGELERIGEIEKPRTERGIELHGMFGGIMSIMGEVIPDFQRSLNEDAVSDIPS